MSRICHHAKSWIFQSLPVRFFRGVVQQKVGQQLIDAGLYSNSYELVNQCFGCTLPGMAGRG